MQCGPNSATIIPSIIDDEILWNIESDRNPFFTIELFTTDSTICNNILNYTLFGYADDYNITNFDEQVDPLNL